MTYESSVLEAFASHCSPDNPPFPNLRTLDVSPSAGQFKLYYRFFHVLFGPRLRIINNSLPANLLRTAKDVLLADYQQMLMRLQESAPHLRHLKLYIDLPSYSPAIISAMTLQCARYPTPYPLSLSRRPNLNVSYAIVK